MDCIKLSFEEGEDLGDVPWAAKNYACSFCRREFRSAQALGGHMNVHRRDRARLRLQLPSTVSSETCLETLDNLNPSSFLTSSASPLSSSAKSCLPYNYSSRHPLVSPSVRSLVSASRDEKKKPKLDHGLNLFPKNGMRGVGYINEEMLKGSAQKELYEKLNKADMKKDLQLDMELELDLHLELGFFKEDKEEVDLELRLGHL